MASNPPDPRQLGRYFVLAQVGIEMVVPIGIGWFVDDWLGWTPWATVVGAVLGMVGGITHLVLVLNQMDDREPGP